MAVKVNNTANIRKAQRWNEQDDAALSLLMKRKIKEVNLAIREANNPYIRAKLKDQKNQYKKMERKISNGTYNGDIIFSEMQAAAALRADEAQKYQNFSTRAGMKKYLNSYDNMDFDFEAYFRKKRYFGISLPILMLILSLIFVAFYIIGSFLPQQTRTDVYSSTGFKIDTLFYFKLSADSTQDFSIKNDGNWPDGDWKVVKSDGTQAILEQGVPYVDATGNTPEYVSLYSDLGMRTVNITTFDVIKSWFRTPMLAKTRLDFLEDNPNFQGRSWYYSKFIGDNKDAITIAKNADGKYDITIIIRHIAVYGTIIFLVAAFLLGVIAVITNIIRLFTYTTRKVHVVNTLAFVFSLLVILLPGFFIMEGTDVVTAFKQYFVLDHATFMEDKTATLMLNPVALISPIIMLINMLLPHLFRNKLKRRPTFVPKGNAPRY